MRARMAMLVLSGALATGRSALADNPAVPYGRPYSQPYIQANNAPTLEAPQPAVEPPPPARSVPHVAATTQPPPTTVTPPVTIAPPTQATVTATATATPHHEESYGGFGADGTDVEFDSDLLIWWTKSAPFPPLVTGSTRPSTGILNSPGVSVVIGDRFIDFNPRAGARFSGRYFIDEGWGIATSVFWMENGARGDTISGLPVLAVPLVNPADGSDYVVRLAGINAATGSASLETGQRFWAADIGTIYRCDDSKEWKVDFIGGFRFVQLVETLKLQTRTTMGVPGVFEGQPTPAGSVFAGLDQYTTRNSFYGFNFGSRLVMELCPDVIFQAQAQCAIGSTTQSVGIIGATGYEAPGQPVQYTAGSTFAQRTNIGKFKGDHVSFIPQVTLGIGYQFNEWIRASFGYDFIYFNNVTRPGDQIDRVVDSSLPPVLGAANNPNATRPFPRIERTDFWAQGISASLQLSF